MNAPVLETTTIPTERLLLRPLRTSDVGLLQLYGSDDRVARMTISIPHPYPPGLAQAFVERVMAGTSSERVWAINASDDEGGLVGVIELDPLSEPDTYDIGFWLAPACWGAGYATEAVGAITAHAQAHGAQRIDAQVIQDNVASARVLVHCGYEYTGEGESFVTARAALTPTFLYNRTFDDAGLAVTT